MDSEGRSLGQITVQRRRLPGRKEDHEQLGEDCRYPAEIQTEDLPIRSLGCYRYTNLIGSTRI
jgi:hypothetical protein